MRILWTIQEQVAFAVMWPCCDVPAMGWADFDDKGNLVDVSPNTKDCQPSGGLNEFLDDQYKKFKAWDGKWLDIVKDQAAYYNMTVEEYTKMVEQMAELQEQVGDEQP